MTREEELEFALRQIRAHVELIKGEVNEHTVTDFVARNNISYSAHQINAILEKADV